MNAITVVVADVLVDGGRSRRANANRTLALGQKNVKVLPDSRHKVFWETDKPKLFEVYTLKWTW